MSYNICKENMSIVLNYVIQSGVYKKQEFYYGIDKRFFYLV